MKNVLGIDPGLPVANAGEIAPKVPGIDKALKRFYITLRHIRRV